MQNFRVDVKELTRILEYIDKKLKSSQAKIKIDLNNRMLIEVTNLDGDMATFTLFDAETAKMAELTTTVRFTV